MVVTTNSRQIGTKMECSWTVKSINSPVTLQITNGLCHRIQPIHQEVTHPIKSDECTWTPPQVHSELENISQSHCYPVRVTQQPDRFHF